VKPNFVNILANNIANKLFAPTLVINKYGNVFLRQIYNVFHDKIHIIFRKKQYFVKNKQTTTKKQ